ncbi:N-acetyltransferase [Streptomyces ferrugineus]|uniref:N-acetyltransferase n=1 Tax=Streptomyces ferrugineus TaxID=1413221 RepID=A0A7M2SES4_9ACTN|nr:GNAT family N-acetyltransferase [Streptomyces ferrugineus]QOV33978.1 N-acetyltransferase [Streptomyces ferrugineus]
MTRFWSVGTQGTWALRLRHVHPVRPGGPAEIVLLEPGRREVGRLRYRVCTACRTGRVLDIGIDESWQGQGLGREALHILLTLHPHHRWTTTTQSRQGRYFFRAMAREVSTGFPSGPPLCSHLRGPLRRHTHRLCGRWLGP